MWGGGEAETKEVIENEPVTGDEAEDGDVEDMNFAEKLSAVVGVLFVEKYEYTVDGLYYGANLISDYAVAAKDKTIGVCGYGAEANPNPANAPVR